MTLILDTPITLGDMAVAAVCQQLIAPSSAHARLSFTCIKRPVAILFLRQDACAAADMNGALLTKKQINKRYPGMLAKLKQSI